MINTRTRRTGRGPSVNSVPANQKYSRQGTTIDKERHRGKNSFRNSKIMKCFAAWVPGSQEHMAFKKKIAIAKRSSTFGLVWDIAQVLFSVLACALYVSETYVATYTAAQVYNYSEIIVTQFFLIDFLFNWFVASTTMK
jgi:hypothetical protein